ncbi:ABC transporter ATP-binding protein [uncultured Oscillibacter sp.]|uniref:ABC transporter ATP-binding protein n=1 Tax=uncultured Oscillibacter sp. TaxID=876091 RepID=UPI0025DA6672|nr:ABC transporter ATP-binding protein [uncultured Oscillibacter sp.]
MRDYLYTEDLSVGYNGQPLIDHICLHLRRGEVMSLIGPNGSGKSTILRSIIRQIAPIRGTVYLDGRSMSQMTALETAKRLSVLMTDRVHPELMTCRDVTATGRYPYTGKLGLLTAADWAKVDEALVLVHGEDLADRDFSQISDGQRQRVLLARALCQEPEVIVLDEPTSFLDIRYKLELLSILKDMVRRQGLAVLMSLHELDLAQKISDYAVCVHNCAIERCGPPEDIFTAEYILALYDAARGSYNPDFGCLELEPPTGAPQVFVIGGGGSGIPVYRRLQRQGVPFAAGVLHENDLDYPVAKALAAAVISEAAFIPIGDAAFRCAAEQMERCPRVLCPLSAFGPMNEKNRLLRELAEKAGKLS